MNQHDTEITAAGLGFGLSEEQEMIVSTVREFVEREVYPHEDQVERTGVVPDEIGAEIKRKCLEMGFYACNFPEEVGGAGLSHLDFALVERELGRGSMALTHFFGRPQNILMACEGEQRERYLLPAVRGERMDALAMTEPDAGSDVRGMKCMARRDGGDWVVNGTKHFISGAEHADFVIVFVATGEDDTPKGPKKRITCFLVDRGHPGFEIADGYESVSHRGYKNMILRFEDCRLPDSAVLGAVDGGFAVMNEWLYATRITVATMAVGRARRVFDMALAYAAEREQFGQKIGEFQLMQGKIADMYTAFNASRAYTYAVAAACDRGETTRQDAAGCLLYASTQATQVALEAIQALGGNGYINDYPTGRLLRDAKLYEIGAGTQEIRRMLIGRELFKETA
ncbi:MAG: acyl-CoA dehydrogenase family protein [Pseudomonadota bacterium]